MLSSPLYRWGKRRQREAWNVLSAKNVLVNPKAGSTALGSTSSFTTITLSPRTTPRPLCWADDRASVLTFTPEMCSGTPSSGLSAHLRPRPLCPSVPVHLLTCLRPLPTHPILSSPSLDKPSSLRWHVPPFPVSCEGPRAELWDCTVNVTSKAPVGRPPETRQTHASR